MKLPDWQANSLKNIAAKNYTATEKVQKPALAVQKLKDEAVKALTSPLDLVILECTYLKDFQASAKFIARKLKAPLKNVEAAIERLVSVN